MEKRRGSGTAFKLSFKLGLGLGSMQNSWKYLWLDSNCQSPAHGYDMVLAIIPPNCKRIQKHLHALVMNGNHVDGFPEGCDWRWWARLMGARSLRAGISVPVSSRDHVSPATALSFKAEVPCFKTSNSETKLFARTKKQYAARQSFCNVMVDTVDSSGGNAAVNPRSFWLTCAWG